MYEQVGQLVAFLAVWVCCEAGGVCVVVLVVVVYTSVWSAGACVREVGCGYILCRILGV